MTTAIYPFEIVVAPGCHGKPTPPRVSRHRTLAAAVRKARTCDRWRVEPSSSAVCLYQAQSQQPTKQGYGLYGGPDTRPLRECLAEAERALREWQSR